MFFNLYFLIPIVQKDMKPPLNLKIRQECKFKWPGVEDQSESLGIECFLHPDLQIPFTESNLSISLNRCGQGFHHV